MLHIDPGAGDPSAAAHLYYFGATVATGYFVLKLREEHNSNPGIKPEADLEKLESELDRPGWDTYLTVKDHLEGEEPGERYEIQEAVDNMLEHNKIERQGDYKLGATLAATEYFKEEVQ